jgi:hypothetical protein
LHYFHYLLYTNTYMYKIDEHFSMYVQYRSYSLYNILYKALIRYIKS